MNIAARRLYRIEVEAGIFRKREGIAILLSRHIDPPGNQFVQRHRRFFVNHRIDGEAVIRRTAGADQALDHEGVGAGLFQRYDAVVVKLNPGKDLAVIRIN